MLETDDIAVERGSVNVFLDIGYPPREAQERLAKAKLIVAIRQALHDRGLTQTQAADLCETDQPTLSKALRGQVGGVTIDRLARWLTALGFDVRITVQAASAGPARLLVDAPAAPERRERSPDGPTHL